MTSDRVIDPDELEYRPIRGDDEFEQLVPLWDLAGWGPVTAEGLKSWFIDREEGASLIMVIVTPDGDIVGQSISTPRRVQIFDRIEIATRGRAAILVPELRRSGRGVAQVDEDDPLRKLGLAGRPHRLARGWRLSFSAPNPLFLERRERQTFAPDLPTSNHVFGPGLRVELAGTEFVDAPLAVRRSDPDDVGDPYDQLWQAARENFGIECAVARDAQALRYRAGEFRLEARDPVTDDLLGYASFWNRPDGKLQDVLATGPETIRPVVRSVFSWLRAHPDEHDMRWCNSFPHPAYHAELVAEGATETEWIFSFSVSSLVDGDFPEVDASRWYVTTGD